MTSYRCYTVVRIVDVRTGSEFNEDGSPVSAGRVEVLLKGPQDEEAQWGSICQYNHSENSVAKV